MRKSIKLCSVLFATALLFAALSCREKTTGEKIEDGIEQVGDDLEEGVEEVEDEIDDATDDN